MTVLIALVLWLTLLGVAIRWPALKPRTCRIMLLLGATIILILSDFLLGVVHAVWTRELAPVHGPAAAFASVWVLVLLPLWRRRLDAAYFASLLFTGLLSLAAAGAAFDLIQLAINRIALGSGILAGTLMIGIIAVLALTGFVLGRQASDADFPWVYAAWWSGWLCIAQPALAPLDPGVDHGLWTLAILLFASGGLESVWQRYGQ
jgi:hypothetical protein